MYKVSTHSNVSAAIFIINFKDDDIIQLDIRNTFHEIIFPNDNENNKTATYNF